MTGPAARRPQALLFACTTNTVRSPMAEGIAKHLFGRDIYIASAGVRPIEPDHFAIAVMDEIASTSPSTSRTRSTIWKTTVSMSSLHCRLKRITLRWNTRARLRLK